MLKRIKQPFLKKLVLVLIIVLSVAIVYGVIAGVGYLAMKVRTPITDSQLKDILCDLIPKSEELNQIIWGTGLELDTNAKDKLQSVSGAQYRPVSENSKYKSVKELKDAIGEVFSQQFILNNINYVAFDGNTDESGDYILYPRYSDVKYTDENGDSVTVLSRDVSKDGFELKSKINPESGKFISSSICWDTFWWKMQYIIVSVEEEFDGTKQNREITLSKDSEGWRLDSPTY